MYAFRNEVAVFLQCQTKNDRLKDKVRKMILLFIKYRTHRICWTPKKVNGCRRAGKRKADAEAS